MKCNKCGYDDNGSGDTAHACNFYQTLSQPKEPEQEPVAWMQDTTCGLYVIDHPDEWHCIPLYTNPPQRTWVGLTDEEYLEALDALSHEGTDREFWLFLEAKLKEKNDV